MLNRWIARDGRVESYYERIDNCVSLEELRGLREQLEEDTYLDEYSKGQLLDRLAAREKSFLNDSLDLIVKEKLEGIEDSYRINSREDLEELRKSLGADSLEEVEDGYRLVVSASVDGLTASASKLVQIDFFTNERLELLNISVDGEALILKYADSDLEKVEKAIEGLDSLELSHSYKLIGGAYVDEKIDIPADIKLEGNSLILKFGKGVLTEIVGETYSSRIDLLPIINKGYCISDTIMLI